ncbi:hypothetical protein AC579_2937 [Pseudocercospora musae]|uniref:Uncharacterized protein n=1 Tax=Pseudocercospora musae TaxID=113226 RepID=A0A139ITY6_9PEZI|nr:hypothetical protein AC579_2937 [Pseudocercospora musae]
MKALDVGRERSVVNLTHLFSRGLAVLSPETLAYYDVTLPTQLDPNAEVADSMEIVEEVEQVEFDRKGERHAI